MGTRHPTATPKLAKMGRKTVAASSLAVWRWTESGVRRRRLPIPANNPSRRPTHFPVRGCPAVDDRLCSVADRHALSSRWMTRRDQAIAGHAIKSVWRQRLGPRKPVAGLLLPISQSVTH